MLNYEYENHDNCIWRKSELTHQQNYIVLPRSMHTVEVWLMPLLLVLVVHLIFVNLNDKAPLWWWVFPFDLLKESWPINTFQKRRVSSAAADTTIVPSGLWKKQEQCVLFIWLQNIDIWNTILMSHDWTSISRVVLEKNKTLVRLFQEREEQIIGITLELVNQKVKD